MRITPEERDDLALLGARWCPKCRRARLFKLFGKNAGTTDGLQSRCKECKNVVQREKYAANPEYAEVRRERASQRYRDNPECGDQWNLDNAERLAEMYNLIDEEGRDVKWDSRRAVKYAVLAGWLPHISECACEHCGEQARDRHHFSYAPGQRIDGTAPLCRGCHVKWHKNHGEVA
jgi:hypothetical protein